MIRSNCGSRLVGRCTNPIDAMTEQHWDCEYCWCCWFSRDGEIVYLWATNKGRLNLDYLWGAIAC